MPRAPHRHPAPVMLALGLAATAAALLLPVPGAASAPATAPAPAPAAATPAASDTLTHTVARGETLSSIARERLGDGARWTEILELNRDRISRPEALQPGTVLRLPGAAGPRTVEVTPVTPTPAGEPGARLVEIEVTGGGVLRAEAQAAPAGTQGPPPADYRERRALLERRPFVPRPAPEPSEAERTLFYGAMTSEVERLDYSEVVLTPESELPVVQPGVTRGAGWIVPRGEAVPRMGQVTGFLADRDIRIAEASVLEGDELRAELAQGADVRPGDRLTTVRAPREVNGVGRILVPTGEVEVIRVDGLTAILRLERAWNQVQLGQLLLPVETREVPVGVQPGPPRSPLAAEVLAFEEEKELYLSGDRLFVDAGARDGIRVGDRFTAWARGSQGSAEVTPAAEFQVVRVDESGATLRITRMIQPRQLTVGTLLERTAQMP